MCDPEWKDLSDVMTELPKLLAGQTYAYRTVRTLRERVTELCITVRNGTMSNEEFVERKHLLLAELFLMNFLIYGQQSKIDSLLKRVEK